jgi:hypothetical protein
MSNILKADLYDINIIKIQYLTHFYYHIFKVIENALVFANTN